jgi:hypothetical protein
MVRSTPLSFTVLDRAPHIFLYQGCRTSGTRKYFLGTRHSVLPDYFMYFNRLALVYCEEHMCTLHIPEGVVIVYPVWTSWG